MPTEQGAIGQSLAAMPMRSLMRYWLIAQMVAALPHGGLAAVEVTCVHDCDVALLREDCSQIPLGTTLAPGPFMIGADCRQTCCDEPGSFGTGECTTAPDSTRPEDWHLNGGDILGQFGERATGCDGYASTLEYDSPLTTGHYQLWYSSQIEACFSVRGAGEPQPTRSAPPVCPRDYRVECDDPCFPDCHCVHSPRTPISTRRRVTPTATPIPTQTPSRPHCDGDCDGDGSVSIDELVLGVGIALGGIALPVPECSGFGCPGPGGDVCIAYLVTAVNNALRGCYPPSTPTTTPTPISTAASVTPTRTGEVGYTITGCVNEFPRTACGQIGVVVQLDPLGLTSVSGGGTQYFRFENVSPGDYVLRVLSGCNPFGCWDEVPVRIIDEDVFIEIDLAPNPTVTPAPGIDLRPSEIIGRGEYQSGCRGPLASLLVCIENDGATSSGPFVVIVQPGDDSFEVADVGAQGRVCADRPFTGWEQSGDHSFTVTVDADNRVAEVNEANNVITAQVHRPTIPVTCSPTPTPLATVASAVPTATTTAQPGHNICGRVQERPHETGYARGVVVILSPPGTRGRVGTGIDPRFCFDGLAPGSYSLSVADRCNPFGCWPPITVELGDQSRSVFFPIEPRATPPQPTPSP